MFMIDVIVKLAKRARNPFIRALKGDLADTPAYRPASQLALDLLRSGQIQGQVVEFGTCTGFTARLLCELLVSRQYDADLYMYDSFTGLPDMVGTPDESSYDVKHNKVWYKGS